MLLVVSLDSRSGSSYNLTRCWLVEARAGVLAAILTHHIGLSIKYGLLSIGMPVELSQSHQFVGVGSLSVLLIPCLLGQVAEVRRSAVVRRLTGRPE